MVIREAVPSDAEAMSRVLIASITELCVADHGRDRTIIENWTSNKSPEGIGLWFANPANHMFVAEEAGEIVCVGGFNDEGEIQLNYVAPVARFRGISKAMLARLEEELRSLGIGEARLTSTTTAHGLYLSAGWVDSGHAEKFGVTSLHPMTKILA